MDDAELMEALRALAREAGIEVRGAGRSGGDSESPPASGVCRVRGAVWVVLSASDPLETQLDVLADALRTHASALIEGRYLLPAVRARLSEPPRSRPG